LLTTAGRRKWINVVVGGEVKWKKTVLIETETHAAREPFLIEVSARDSRRCEFSESLFRVVNSHFCRSVMRDMRVSFASLKSGKTRWSEKN